MAGLEGMTITALTHDFVRQTSFVSLAWDGAPEKSLVLQVPFGCRVDDVALEAGKAVRSLGVELATIALRLPG